MKISTVKSSLIKQSIILLVALSVVAAPVFYIDYLCDVYAEKIKRTNAENNGLANELTQLTTQANNANSWLVSYSDIIKKYSDKKLSVNKNVLRDNIVELRKKYKFGSFDANISSIKQKEGDKYKTKSKIFAEDGDVSIKLAALSDVDVFLLIQSLKANFTAIRFTKFNLSLAAKELDSSVLLSIRNSGFTPIVNADITFTWSGLQNLDVDKENNASSKEDGDITAKASSTPVPQSSAKQEGTP